MEYTKGPWSKVTSNGIMTTNGTVVAITTTDGVLSKEAKQANARLIAAAPELLEALIELKEWFDYGNHCEERLYNKLEAAIQKATLIK